MQEISRELEISQMFLKDRLDKKKVPELRTQWPGVLPTTGNAPVFYNKWITPEFSRWVTFDVKDYT